MESGTFSVSRIARYSFRPVDGISPLRSPFLMDGSDSIWGILPLPDTAYAQVRGLAHILCMAQCIFTCFCRSLCPECRVIECSDFVHHTNKFVRSLIKRLRHPLGGESMPGSCPRRPCRNDKCKDTHPSAPFAIAAEPFGRILGSSEDISEEFSEEWKYREPPDFFSGVFHPRAFMMAYPFYTTHCPNHSVHQMYAAKRFAFSTQLIANSLHCH
jgi:hypothetical protein